MCKNYFEIYDIPYRSTKYFEVKKKIESELIKKPTFRENLICVESVVKPQCSDGIRRLFDKKFVKRLSILDDNSTFVSDHLFKYVPRYIAEYDPGLYQLECCLLAYDEYGNVLLLQKNKSRTDGLTTMLQGHVEYSSEIYTTSKNDFIKLNMIREIKEEVSNFPKITIDNLEHCGYIYSCKNLVKMIHLGVVFKCRISHNNMTRIISNEPTKHKVIVVNYNNLCSGTHNLNLDPWLEEIIMHSCI